MRILVVNWQDRENPDAGGAELHLHETFGRLARAGHEVDLLCSGFRGATPRVSLDGLSVHRVGGRHSFPLHARRYYGSHLAARNHDVLVEDLNKVPLFTPWWKARHTVVLVHHLFGATAFREVSPPVAALVWLLERPLPMAYRGLPFEAVSESTAADLAARGVPRTDVRVIHVGVDVHTLTPDPAVRASVPTFAYLGRLRRYKRVETLIRAFAYVRDPDAVLEIAGAGPDRARLERLVGSLDLTRRVKFLGLISERAKLALLRRAWATLLASPKEGWGISNLESAACGTPVIAADAPGLRESVVDGETGYLVSPNTPLAFATAINRLAVAPQLVRMMSGSARAFAERFSWERTAANTIAHLEEIVGRRG